MKLKITITGPKVNDVGYRYFLLGIAMSNRIRMFEAHNMRSSEGQAVLAFADGDEEAIKAFCAQIETERPARSEVSNIVFDDFQGEVMRIGEYAQFCATIQLNKAIPVLLDMRDDLRAVRKNTDLIPQTSDKGKHRCHTSNKGKYGCHTSDKGKYRRYSSCLG
ncbi:acylphosphatase [Methanothrix sp.]|uniref:acylphosphatase n=1 Tax=Methanothrix sp. TaxID=90426 RepID=UPI0023526F69|nr:acylphosphatase [Methanothrix sp.]